MESLIAAGLIPRRLLRKNYFITEVRHSRMHLAGIQAGTGTHSTRAQGHGEQSRTMTGPPIKTFGGDAFGTNSYQCSLIPRSLLLGSSLVR